jgi:hypothetical protein
MNTSYSIRKANVMRAYHDQENMCEHQSLAGRLKTLKPHVTIAEFVMLAVKITNFSFSRKLLRKFALFLSIFAKCENVNFSFKTQFTVIVRALT